MSKLKIKKDDMVLVMAGNSKDRKTNGKYPAPHKVLKVLVKENMAIVEACDECWNRIDRLYKEKMEEIA